jgi:hypothetical protein
VALPVGCIVLVAAVVGGEVALSAHPSGEIVVGGAESRIEDSGGKASAVDFEKLSRFRGANEVVDLDELEAKLRRFELHWCFDWLYFVHVLPLTRRALG